MWRKQAGFCRKTDHKNDHDALCAWEINMDLHTHSRISYDGKQTMEELVTAAEACGMKYVAITEHCDMDLTRHGYTYHKLPDYDAYFAELAAVRAAHPNVDVLAGVELGFSPESNGDYAGFLSGKKLDVVLNSVHIVDGEDVYDKSYYESRSREKAYLDYLSAVRQSLDVPYDYDVVGHIGYIARRSLFEPRAYEYCEYADVLDDVLSTIVSREKCLEVNTLTPPGYDFLPLKSVLERYRALGGELLSIGSDAHVPSRVGEHFPLALDLLKSLGFPAVYVYKNRKPVAIGLYSTTCPKQK